MPERERKRQKRDSGCVALVVLANLPEGARRGRFCSMAGKSSTLCMGLLAICACPSALLPPGDEQRVMRAFLPRKKQICTSRSAKKNTSPIQLKFPFPVQPWDIDPTGRLSNQVYGIATRSVGIISTAATQLTAFWTFDSGRPRKLARAVSKDFQAQPP